MSNQYSSTDGPGPVSGAIMFLQAQAGDLASLNQLMSHHDGLVQVMVRRQVLGDLPFAEALQAGRIGLWRAILGYDPARGFAFSTYACPLMKASGWKPRRLRRGGKPARRRRECYPAIEDGKRRAACAVGRASGLCDNLGHESETRCAYGISAGVSLCLGPTLPAQSAEGRCG